MGHIVTSAVGLRGRSLLRAWMPGALEEALRRGLTLPCAQEWALRQGAMRCSSLTHNMIVTLGLNLIAAMLIDESEQYDVGLTYHAIGTGTTSPALSDTILETEVARILIASRARVGNEATFSAFYTAASSTYVIQEAAIFGSSTASEEEYPPGVLFARYLQYFDNSGGDYDLTFDYQLSVEAG
jgi:predicted anti-sigma-YlaC factor YlaD